jgi:hypothetical protein
MPSILTWASRRRPGGDPALLAGYGHLKEPS